MHPGEPKIPEICIDVKIRAVSKILMEILLVGLNKSSL